MKYTYKLVKRVYHTVVFENEGPGREQENAAKAIFSAVLEEDNPMELLADGDDWEVEESTEEED